MINLVVALLVLLDVLSLRNNQEFSKQVVTESSPNEVAAQPAVSCQSISRTHLLSTQESTSSPSHAKAISLTLYPRALLRHCFFVVFVVVFFVHVVMIMLPRKWLETTPTWVHRVVFVVNGGLSPYHHLYVEYLMVLLIAFINHVYQKCPPVV